MDYYSIIFLAQELMLDWELDLPPNIEDSMCFPSRSTVCHSMKNTMNRHYSSVIVTPTVVCFQQNYTSHPFFM